MASKIAIVAGYLARYPLGGHMLSLLHWLTGLQKLGYQVVFMEHYGWPNACFDPHANQLSDDPTVGLAALRREFARFGLRHWCYVDAQGTYHGLSQAETVELCRKADFLLGLWIATWLDQFGECRKRILIDTDPGFTQFSWQDGAVSGPGYASPYDFDFHFSYGARIGRPDCPIPTQGLTWRPVNPPVTLELLPPCFTPDARLFTTVMNWSNRQPIVYDGVEYGQKDVEFWRFAEAPRRLGPIFEIALAGKTAPRAAIRAAGWRLVDALAITATPQTYCDYLAGSRGEFSVAVNLEVKARSGWFSDRSSAYLASGKPIIVQDTGFSETLPCGEGLFAFQTIEDVANAVEAINRDYLRHCRAARRLAEEHFDSTKILTRILRECDE